MLNDSRQLEELRALVSPVCAAHGLELCDARFVSDHGPVLRVLIERPGDSTGGSGVSLADCQAVSRDLSTVLDVESEHLPHLTRRFYRTHPGRSRASGGTGLGLAIVKHIVERHRGRLDIASKRNVGTTVTVRLPAIADADAQLS